MQEQDSPQQDTQDNTAEKNSATDTKSFQT